MSIRNMTAHQYIILGIVMVLINLVVLAYVFTQELSGYRNMFLSLGSFLGVIGYGYMVIRPQDESYPIKYSYLFYLCALLIIA